MDSQTDMAMNKRNDGVKFINEIFNEWPIAVAIAAIIFSWAHFQSSLQYVSTKVDNLQLQANVADANYATLNGNIEGINAKLDIILKHDNL